MKNNLSRTYARRVIFWYSLLISTALMCVAHIPLYVGWTTSNYWLVIPLIGQPVFAALLAIYRIHQGDDMKLLKKLQEKYEKRIASRKSEIHALKAQVQTEHYSIKSIIPEENKICVFRIAFVNKIIHRAMPAISLNGIRVSVKVVNDFEALCYGEKAIMADEKKLVFKSGDFEHVINNPYYISEHISGVGIKWQYEGHPHEKNIYINESYLPYISVRPYYAFNLFVNGKMLGEYCGNYIPEMKSIVVNIRNIDKFQCRGKDCFLKPVFDVRRKITLPEPIVLLVNSKPEKKEVVFS
ncbi:MAG: hypothetical protein WA101_00280 [Minisyncoccia bacterium]